MPDSVFFELKKAWVCGQRLNITRINAAPTKERKPPKAGGPKKGKPGKDK